MSENNTNPTVEAVKLTRAEKLLAQIEMLKKRITADTIKVNEVVAEYNNIAALEAVEAGTNIVIQIGRKFADKDTTRQIQGKVLGVQEDEATGSKRYKVAYGTGFDADFAVVASSGIVKVLAEGEVFVAPVVVETEVGAA
jgi:hypothetical protein